MIIKKISEILEKLYSFLLKRNNTKRNFITIIFWFIIFKTLDSAIQEYSKYFVLKKMGIFLYISIFYLILVLNHTLLKKFKLTNKELILAIVVVFLPLMMMLLK